MPQLNPQPASSAEPLVAMVGVSKSYGNRLVLDGVDVQVREREHVALIGPSGSGKTTILRLLIGLDRPDAGDIRIGGRPLWPEDRKARLGRSREGHAREVRRMVGMVFQHFNLFPHMTALENVREPMVQVLRMSRNHADAEASSLLAQVGLQRHLHQRPAQLSGGQQQRVAIARSLGLKPRVMLFDEVTSALDPELVGEVLRVIRELAQASDMTMLVVTHEIQFAADIADRVLMFDSGRIVEEGPPAVVLKDPANQRTRQFLRAILQR
jgi:polar amino acid transport system ATP-binding protein